MTSENVTIKTKKLSVYLDLNIFDRLEKIAQSEEPEKSSYQKLLSALKEEKILTAYSNAHLNDLFRGFQNSPGFVEGHLNNIKLLTHNLCICLYWKEPKAKLHYRDIQEFFQEKVNEWEFESASYDDLLKDQPLLRVTAELAKHIPLPAQFKKCYTDPMFGIMFPLSKIHNNQYALQADIYNFQMRLKSDYGLYKSFKTYLLTNLQKVRSDKNLLKSLQLNFNELPKHLELIEALEEHSPATKTKDSSKYSKVIDLFFKNDLAGYKTDGHFNNMFDDALHCFYASHFDFFITNDDRCKYKAEKTYQQMKITTKVLKISEIDILKVD